jgi:hypothetical protein
VRYNEKVVVNGVIYPRDEGLELSKELGCEAIDEPIYEVCKILTDKGYELNYSCSGHIDSERYKSRVDFELSLGFVKDYGFEYPIPCKIEHGIGMHHKDTSIGYSSYFKSTNKDKEKAFMVCAYKRSQWIQMLKEWAIGLEDLNKSSRVRIQPIVTAEEYFNWVREFNSL